MLRRFGDTEVDNSQSPAARPAPAGRRYRASNLSVNDAFAVHGLQAAGDLHGDAAGAHGVEAWALVQDDAAQRLAPLGTPSPGGRPSGKIPKSEMYTVFMVDSRPGGFAQEALLVGLFSAQQDLQCDEGVEQHVARLIDDAHAALREARHHLIALADRLAG